MRDIIHVSFFYLFSSMNYLEHFEYSNMFETLSQHEKVGWESSVMRSMEQDGLIKDNDPKYLYIFYVTTAKINP